MPKELSEELITVTMVLSESGPLQKWFFGLEKAPLAVRGQEFHRLAESMAADGEDEQVVRAIRSLSQPEIYKAVSGVLREGSD